jgi:small subunit ribosomal protein S1
MMQQASGTENGRTSTRLRPGQAVTGSVVQIGHDCVFVDVGATAEGRIDRRELEDDKGQLKVQIGDTLKASVVSIDDVLGPRLSVAFGRGRSRLDEGALETARDAKVAVEGVVGSAVKGGVEVRIMGTRAFCPASQLGTEFIADLSSFEGQKLEFLVTEVKNGGRDVIVSRKALLLSQQSQQSEQTLADLVVGNDYPAKVVSVQKYGAFVNLGGGVEGLIHISELTHGRVERVEDVLNVGEEVTVRLLAVQPGEKGAAPKLRLSLRALSDRPATEAEPERGEVLEGTVSKVTPFGVFVDTAKGTGLVPTRELGTPKNSDNRRMFPIGKVVSVVLVSKDASRGVTFSMSRVANVEERQNYREFSRTQKSQKDEPSTLGSFGALLRQELKLPEPPPAPARVEAPAPAHASAVSSAAAPAAAAPSAAAAAARPHADAPAPGASAPAHTPARAAKKGRFPPPRAPMGGGAPAGGPAPAERARIAEAEAASKPEEVRGGSAVLRGRRRPQQSGSKD